MNVFYFGTGTRRLFGLYRPGNGQGPAARAAVLCAPWGQEYLRAHRSMRQLGIQLNAAGFHVLQFDYYGTGDSAGDMTDASIRDWEDDIAVAIDELRATSGADRVTLVGLRLGATLAARNAVAQPAAIRDLVLWDPIVSGPDYLQDLLQSAGGTERSADFADPENVNGFPLTGTVAQELSSIDLVSLVGGFPRRTLAIASNEDASAPAPYPSLAEALARHDPASGMESVQAPPAWVEYQGSGTSLMPVAALRRITEWAT
jgi:pimeloyl-ACP methyl ester carboxylesterase